MSFEQISQKLAEHDKRFDEHDRRFDEHDRRFDEHDRRFDRIEQKLVDHDLRFDRVEARLDQTVTKQEFYGVMDKAMTILTRLDQERTFTTEWIHRIENDLGRVKKILRLA
jgi:hypothetical protein